MKKILSVFLIVAFLVLTRTSLVEAETSVDYTKDMFDIEKILESGEFEVTKSSMVGEKGINYTLYETSDKNLIVMLTGEDVKELPRRIEIEVYQNDFEYNTSDSLKKETELDGSKLSDDWAVRNFNKVGYWMDESRPFKSFTIYGPDTFTMSETESSSVIKHGTISIFAKSIVTAVLGYDYTKSYEWTWGSSTPVIRGEALEVEIFTKYVHHEFEMWAKPPSIGVYVYHHDVETYKPVGAYVIKKFFPVPV